MTKNGPAVSSDTSRPMSEHSLLKLQLLSSRGTYIPGKGLLPICPICHNLIYLGSQNADLHEALISRGQLNDRTQLTLINSRFNCVLRHHICPGGKLYHSPGVGGDQIFAQCASQLMYYEGGAAIRRWLLDMTRIIPVVAEQAYLRFDAVERMWMGLT